ncbi:hypothetical protein ID866_5316 [Astraeus odoratus]|nr:hypothetical protein ID866_5316 [Astraeus odoratus]
MNGAWKLIEYAIESLPGKPIVIRLSGHLQHNARLALREVAQQLSLQTDRSLLAETDDNTDQEHNPFLDSVPSTSLPPPSHLPALISMLPTFSRPTIVILDAFDLFAHHARQSLLYCLLDTVQGCRVGQGIIKTNEEEWEDVWRLAVEKFLDDRKVIAAMTDAFALTRDIRMLQKVLIRVVVELRPASPFPTLPMITSALEAQWHPQFLDLHLLSYPSICLLIAAMHAKTAGHDVITFEMLHETFKEQLRASAAAPVHIEGGGIGMTKCTRGVLMSAFEQLLATGMFLSVAAPSVNVAPEFFGLYVVIRQLVNTKEWLTAWRGRKGLLRKRLRAARTYEEWKEAALALDEYLHFDEWKRIDEDAFYDWKLVRKVRRSLRVLREKNDVICMYICDVLIELMEHHRLYSETFYGTKNLIESYYNEQEEALRFIRESVELSNEEKKRFFKSASTNLGASALCLSGGASFGYYHFGVVKAFLDGGLLPRVIAGTSAGGLIAALLVKSTGHVSWARKCTFFTRGSMTFREAYMRTGRILNISVIPADRHSPTKLLNYLTAPDTIIWSAVLASAAVPGILNPVVLMQKLPDGRIIPWNWGSKFKDGSLRVDIPIQALNLYFNGIYLPYKPHSQFMPLPVTHPVVSQVNPHVHLFFFAPRGSAGKPVAHSKGKGWRGNFLLSAAEQYLKLELTKNFKACSWALSAALRDWSSVFLQRFEGTVTIWPKTRVWDWFRILSDPDPVEFERMRRVGQIVTWPKLHMIENRFRIEKQILLGRQAVRNAMQLVKSSPSAVDFDGGIADGSNLPEPITGTHLPTTSNDTDPPLPMDTDTENAFANRGTVWYFKRGRPTAAFTPESGSSTPYGNGHPNSNDPLRSPSFRRKWAFDLLDERTNGDEYSRNRPATPDPPTRPDSPSSRHINTNSGSPNLLARLRPKSLTTLTIPFSTAHRFSAANMDKPPSPDIRDVVWSTDSSSEDDFPFERLSGLRFSSPGNRGWPIDSDSAGLEQYE